MNDPAAKPPFNPSIPVSADNPCPFLRGLVGEGFIDGGTVPLRTLSQTIANASGEVGLKKVSARFQVRGIALIANGACHILQSIFWGAQLNRLRGGPLDKLGAGSRILGVDGIVNEDQIARLAGFGSTYANPDGGTEVGLNASQIQTFMKDNLKRAGHQARWYYPILMKFEWPVLLRIMGKGEGDDRYLSVAEVRTLFNERKFPDRVTQRIVAQPVTPPSLILRAIGGLAAALFIFGVVALRFPDQFQPMLPHFIGQLVAPPLPKLVEPKAAYWLEQNWALEDRHWFHHASQGTATFPVPYTWFMALEQPRLHFFAKPGMLHDSDHLQRFGFIPSPQTIDTDDTTLRRFGYANVYDKTKPVPARLWDPPVDWGKQAENVDGLPVGFARMTGVPDPATGQIGEDRIGLTCAACHTGQIHYKGIDIRFDGGPAMTDLRRLEVTTGLSIAYTLFVPGRFTRFADRVLGASASDADRDALKQKLSAIGTFLKDWEATYDKTIAGKTRFNEKTKQNEPQTDTEEGYGRLDALNRIGNQVFSQDMALSGLSGFEKNLHAKDAPVSFPPIWTVPWLKYAQYDASIEQPLIRNAGEALGVTALLNLSDKTPEDTLFRSSMDIRNLNWIEGLLKGSAPYPKKQLSGLTSPKWPSDIIGDEAWKIDGDRVKNGRKLYAQICAECHLGPVNDPVFDAEFPEQSIWSSPRWKAIGDDKFLNEVQKGVKGMGTDPAQANVLATRTVQVPGFLKLDPTQKLNAWWGCKLKDYSSTDMPYSVGLMVLVDIVSRKAMKDANISGKEQEEWWGKRQNCPNPGPQPPDKPEPPPWYRARPLNGVWATAPYLHNGSVPSLWWMLSPAADRPKSFCMGGGRDYDPKQVGFAVTDGESCKTGQSRFSTRADDGTELYGNSNLGHSFEGNGPPHKDGVVGRKLEEEERKDLIEYLKKL
ncbi:di-heme-cytochrome C peroxidase [Bradyrhizobium sp. BR 10289]|uniref:di-heme-cytochrome C peroxidase n=1 Tax=Bradyrhizobium sp. BR 10289 TaxID=2749993 RepID=UPI001C653489|nr:di-heme-cytochrome C peroxidase [Bradyrhizobium sp. BR 10289]MBW7972362.1 cytochrome C [Bradyrhizobium sp. BR 10289]